MSDRNVSRYINNLFVTPAEAGVQESVRALARLGSRFRGKDEQPADIERSLQVVCTRTAEGRSRARKRRQHMGRPSKLSDAQKAEARRRQAEGATLAELARSYDVEKSTIPRL